MRTDNPRILVIIPARGGSKGIPRKNIRLMNGKPLISYTIECAKHSRFSPDIFVSTDSDEISEIGRNYGADVIIRDASLSSDLVTLDPVIYDALIRIENNESSRSNYDYVITMQPTSPLLTTETLDKAIENTIRNNYDTVISAVNHPHLSWGVEGKKYTPLYEKRLNRQELPPQFLETGAFVISKRGVVKKNTRIGKNVSIFEVKQDESIDIDDYNDWIIAESILKKKKIILRADGYVNLGLGHIYNCITMASKLIGHDVLILTKKDAKVGIAKLDEMHVKYETFEKDEDLDCIIKEFKPDIWVNDCLNTTASYIKFLKKRIKRVVTIEDLGSGIKYADAVINALYEDVELKNVYSGFKYVCLRDEFLTEKPKPFSDEVKNIVIMFGGTDPSNLNGLLYKILVNAGDRFNNIRFNFITGIGYDYKKNNVISRPERNIYVFPDVPRVTKYLKEADMAIIGQGRTIFEVACMGVPTIVLSQNAREVSHQFAQMDHGFINLGLGKKVAPSMIINTIEWLVMTPAIRKNMHELMLKTPLRDGGENVKNIILGEERKTI